MRRLAPLLAVSLLCADEFDATFDAPVAKVEKSALSLSGHIGESMSYNTHSTLEGVSSLKTLGDVALEYHYAESHAAQLKAVGCIDPIYTLRNLTIPDGYDYEVELGESYLSGKLIEGVDYAIGRMVVGWGKSDTIKIVDILNPIDNRNPAITDFKNLKLPVGMAKIDGYLGDFKLSIIDIFEQRFMKFPQNGSGYITMNLPDIATPSYEQQLAMSLETHAEGWDGSLYLAHAYNDSYYISQGSINPDMVEMLGLAYAQSIGGFLVKTEIATIIGAKLSSAVDEKNIIKALVGIDWIIPDGSVGLEVADSLILDYVTSLNKIPFNLTEHTPTYAARYSQAFINNTLTLNALLMVQGWSGEIGGLGRIWGGYELSDNLKIEAGYIEYLGGDGYLYESMKENDKFFASLTYSF